MEDFLYVDKFGEFETYYLFSFIYDFFVDSYLDNLNSSLN
jgi:hypothetical protein